MAPNVSFGARCGAQRQRVLRVDGDLAVDRPEERRALADVDLVVDVGVDVADEGVDGVALGLPLHERVELPLRRRRAEVREVAPAGAVDRAGLRILQVVARDERRVGADASASRRRRARARAPRCRSKPSVSSAEALA